MGGCVNMHAIIHCGRRKVSQTSNFAVVYSVASMRNVYRLHSYTKAINLVVREEGC